jgi:hypothetical protein
MSPAKPRRVRWAFRIARVIQPLLHCAVKGLGALGHHGRSGSVSDRTPRGYLITNIVDARDQLRAST